MTRLTFILSCLALCAGLAALAMLHGTRNTLKQMDERVTAIGDRGDSEVENLWSRWRRGRGIDSPVKPPRHISGAYRMEWTNQALNLWGWDEKRCREEGGEKRGHACRFIIVDRGRPGGSASEGAALGGPAVEGHTPSWPDPRTAEGAQEGRLPRVSALLLRFEEELRLIQAEVRAGPCRSDHARAACEVGVELELPTLGGVGVLMGRLMKWPYVLSALQWDNGKLSLRGHLIGGA